jgi:hypothetical protein
MREARADGLDFTRVFALRWRKGDAARHDHARQIRGARERHHHRGKTLVARGDAEHAASQWKRPNQSPEHDRGVVPIRQRIEHSMRALRAPVARIADRAGKRHRALLAKFPRGRFHELPDFPVTRVIPERDRLSVGRAQSALGAEDEELRARRKRRLPAHAHILREAE